MNKLEKFGFFKKFVIIAGPCAIESYFQLKKTASLIKEKIDILRGGAFKPRTSPYSFQGLGKKGLIYLKKVSKELNLPTVTEVLDPRDVSLVAKYVDILQIGARNMSNFPLLKEVGKIKKPVLLKRGFSATIKEWLLAAEYIKLEGNKEIILCERGIRTFEERTRFTLDLAGALLAKKESGLPTIVDPSHATGIPFLIPPLSKAAKSAGLDGLMIEVHFQPKQAKCDKEQSLTPKVFNNLIKEIKDEN